MTVEAKGGQEHREESLIRTIRIDPQEMMGRSWAYLSLDEDTRDSMLGRNFSPSLYLAELPQVVRVQDRSRPEGFRFEMLNGHHRLTGAASFLALREQDPEAYRLILNTHREALDKFGLVDFVPLANDITNDIIARKYPVQNHLTDKQHFDEMKEAETAHQELISERIAAHFFTKWPNLVREQTARRFTPFAALVRIGLAPLNHTPEAIERFFQTQRVLYAGETPKDRKGVENALITMATSMQTREVAYPDILADAFKLVAKKTGDPVADQTRISQQIEGFFVYPEVVKKMLAGATDGSVVEDRRNSLKSVVATKIDDIDSMRNIRTFYNILTDSRLSFDDMLEVFEPKKEQKTTLKERYDEKVLDARIRGNEQLVAAIVVYPWIRTIMKGASDPMKDAAVYISIPEKMTQANAILEALPKKDPNRTAIVNVLRKIQLASIPRSLKAGLEALDAIISGLNSSADKGTEKRKGSEDSPSTIVYLATELQRALASNPPSDRATRILLVDTAQAIRVYLGGPATDDSRREGTERFVVDSVVGDDANASPETKELIKTLKIRANTAASTNGVSPPSLVARNPNQLFTSDWRYHGRCAGNTGSVNVKGDALQTQRKEEVCGGCPVQLICRADALAHGDRQTQGFLRGGMTAEERRRLIRDPQALAPLRNFTDGVAAASRYQNGLLRRSSGGYTYGGRRKDSGF